MVSHYQNRMADSHNSAFFAPAGGQPVVAGFQISIFGSRSRPGGFGQNALEAEAVHVSLKDVDGPGLDKRLEGLQFALRFAVGQQCFPTVLADERLVFQALLDLLGEHLLGKGDMLYLAADAGYPVRVQGCFVSEEEVEEVVNHLWKC
mgnify:CR=1 FL=1